jgi:hypothetical protein
VLALNLATYQLFGKERLRTGSSAMSGSTLRGVSERRSGCSEDMCRKRRFATAASAGSNSRESNGRGQLPGSGQLPATERVRKTEKRHHILT